MGLAFSSPEKEKPLEKDLRRLMNDERFHDIALKCSDGKIVFGYKPILATRSEIFDELILTESENNILSFSNINSNAMKIILEYLYTSNIREGSINVDNFIEVYYAVIHFKLSLRVEMCFVVTSFLKDGNEDTSKKLLSEFINKFSLITDDMDDDEVLKTLVYWIAKDKLKKNEIDSLSIEGLRYLLMKTFDTKEPFATPEIEIWEYIIMKTKREAMMYDQQEIQKYLIPFARYVNLERMDAEEIKTQVEPYNVYSNETLKDAYFSISSGRGLGFIRGVPFFKWKNDNSDLTISKYGMAVESNFIKPKSILGDLIFKGRGVYEWKILVEKLCKTIYIGICDINVNLRKSDRGYHGWVLGSDGYVYYKNEWKWYDAKFKEGDKVTVHLDMKNRTCAFSINDNRKPLVSGWKNIPSRVYPIVSLGYGSKLSIEHQGSKNIFNPLAFNE
ncbi:hypothetical protein RclHR1_01520021 [Rhizophagus clarus]|uniref:BTB domain-containing protein n=1 Tax=Rhizophagus clarus TaxID=94130 RepID=A0A2Z6R766_9GLOM|nr:hypothetical protein RclHR1_01520021 [Rhizophagus clarus]GES78714.1 hypothetical protein GLOIN_2v1545445 [Rhizophagus clarus]